MKKNIADEIEQVEKKIDELNIQLRIEKAVLSRLKAIGGKKQASAKGHKALKKDSLAARIRTVLINSGKQMSVAEIIEKLQEQDVGTDSPTGLGPLVPSAISRRPDIFRRVRRGVYDLKSRVRETGIE